MKKQFLISLIAAVPLTGFAKGTDFNALILENTQAQRQLHSAVKNNVQEAKEVAFQQTKREKIVLIDSSQEGYAAPTSKDLLIFEKERSFHRASDSKQLDRLAHEISQGAE